MKRVHVSRLYKADMLTEINPKFNRDGWYMILDIKNNACKSWFETDGKAYVIDNSLFKITLDRFSRPVLRDCEIQALELLSLSRLLSKEQANMLYMSRESVRFKCLKIDARKRKRKRDIEQ